ncbi:TPA: phage tail protein [Serratia fonticola]|nr:phage tail protein [Serratia fonticola]
MSAIITRKFEQWCAERTANNLPARPDTFIFAYVPGQDPDGEADRDEALPPASQIMHRAPVAQYGMINTDAVAYSVVLDTKVGDFDYNWIGLLDADSGTLCMIVHTRTQKKIATSGQLQGNTLSRTLVMEFNGAAGASQITVTAATWQIDFSARIFGQDDQLRLANLEVYGQGSFFGAGFLIVKNGNTYTATAGRGYVGGIRAELKTNTPVAVAAKPTLIWADVSWQGATTSAWSAHVTLTAADDLVDYIDPQHFPHYVTAIARVEADGSVTDLRKKGSQGEQEASRLFLRKDQNLADIDDATEARKNIGLDKVGNFMAVEQGGGVGMNNNKVRIGWGENQRLVAQVDDTGIGEIYSTQKPPTASETGAFPISGGYVNGSVGTKGGEFIIADADGNPIAKMAAAVDGAVNVYSFVTQRYFGLNSAGDFYASNGSSIIESGQRVYSPNNRPDELHVNGSTWWSKDSSGKITQGGIVTRTNDNNPVTFPIPFPNAVLNVQLTVNYVDNNESNKNPLAQAVTNSGFVAWLFSSELSAYWRAEGF